MRERAGCGAGTCAILVLVGLAGPAAAEAQDGSPLIGDRPDFTESPVVVEPGGIQLEMGFTFAKLADVERQTFGEALARVGAARRLEVRLGLNSYAVSNGHDRDTRGLEDASLGLKVALFQPDATDSRWAPATAVIGAITLPTGEDEESSPDVRPSALASLGWDVAERLGLGLNLGWQYGSAPTDRFHELRASASLAVAFAERWGGFFEWFGVFPEEAGGPSRNALDTGLTWLAGSHVQLDWRIGIGLESDSQPDWFTGAGVVVRP